MVLAYDGGRYHGWQRQKRERTVQGVLEEHIQMMVGEPVKVIASGRTDAGVHAMGQVCHFLTRTGLTPRVIQRGLNALLPDDIWIKEAEYAAPDFHARYGVKGKTYEYRLLNRPEPDLFQRHYVWHIPMPLDREKMATALSFLKGRHDFSAFRSAGSGNLNPVRTMTRADLQDRREGLFCVVMAADGFLRHMVRNIVGTLVEVGLGKIGPARFEEVLGTRDRRLAGVKAPPQGLFLVRVDY